MATPSPPRTSQDNSSLTRVMSHGRGGAGNIGTDENGYKESEEDMRIPTLKSPVYTTGRGGTGNMALNVNPKDARAAQDVEVDEVPRPPSNAEFHGGRGGAGNIVDPTEEEAIMAQQEEDKQRHAVRQQPVNASSMQPVDHSKIDYRGWADRGKDLLFGKKKKSRP